MLVLSRKKNETLVIGGGDSGVPLMTVTIIEIRGDKVRLGVEAPTEVPVHRHEVYEAIQQEKLRAAALAQNISPTPRPETTGLIG